MDNKIDKIDVGRLTNWPIDSHTVAAVPAPVPQVIMIIIIIILFFTTTGPENLICFTARATGYTQEYRLYIYLL